MHHDKKNAVYKPSLRTRAKKNVSSSSSVYLGCENNFLDEQCYIRRNNTNVIRGP